jgi:hypothetical protein
MSEAPASAAENALAAEFGATTKAMTERDWCHGRGHRSKGQHQTYEKDLIANARHVKNVC